MMGRFCILSSRLVFSRVLIAFVLACPCVPSSAAAAVTDLVVNEVYYDHPGADAGYEFVEVYNPLQWPAPLAGVTLEFHNGSGEGWVVLWAGGAADTVAANSVFTIGAGQVTPAPDVVVDLSLQNGPDAVALFRDGVAVDIVGYGGLDDPRYVETIGADAVPPGRSIARIPDGSDSGDNRADFVAAPPTPARTNVARHDAALALAAATPLRAVVDIGFTEIALELVNPGIEPIAAEAVRVTARDSTATGVRAIGAWRNGAEIAAGASEPVVVALPLDEGHHWIAFTLQYGRDERAHNDTLVLLRRAGSPALLVSEVLSSPPSGCPQFVELYNAGQVPLSIAGYGLRDRSHDPVPVAGDAVMVAPGRFVVITADPAALGACFGVGAEGVFTVDGTWPTINRTGGEVADSVVLVDDTGLAVDAVAVPAIPTAAAGRSLERVDLYRGGAATWVLSSAPSGASPGWAGVRTLYAPPPPGSIAARPNPFFPSEGVLVISIDAPAGARVVATVFDTRGRLVSDVGVAMAFPAVLVWNGRDVAGNDALPGLYVLACEIDVAGNRRVETVVVGCGRR